ncbi:MAG: hypothetical protein IJ759_00750 [Bacteroidales bacterium]|nr:hypothetical protein [Bacteroidales bacterium]
MLQLKKIAFIVGIALIMFSCSKGEKKVLSAYEDGKPYIVVYVKNQDGKEIRTYEEHFYNNGKTRVKGSYSKGEKNGTWKYYFEDGTLFAQTDYSNSKEGEKWQVYFDKDSLLVNKTDQLLNIAFSPEGTPVSMRIKNSKNEVFLRFFESFKLMERVSLKGNVPQGEAMSWYENGNINSIHFYTDGLQDSSYTVYAESGQKILSGTYKKGTKVGKWEYFSSDGKPLGYEIFDIDGTRLSFQDNQGLRYSTTPPSQDLKK